LNGGVGYAHGIYVGYANSIVFNAPGGQLFFGYASLAPVTITRGGGDTTGIAAQGVCIVSPQE